MRRHSIARYALVAAIVPWFDLGGQNAPPALVQGRLAPIAQEEEVALALSAAPGPVAVNAGAYVLRDTGFALVRRGTNGFSCLVERFAGRSVFPTCYDSAASKTILPAVLLRESLQRGGVTQEKADSLLEEEFARGRFAIPPRGAVAYRFSPRMGFYARSGTWVPVRPFVMILAPYSRTEALGYPSERAREVSASVEMGVTNPGRASAYFAFVVDKN